MIREIISYPDKLLFEHSLDVDIFNNTLSLLLDDMYETMMHSGGVGLAAIQVGQKLNVLIINLPNEDAIQDKKDLIEAVNPKIINFSGEQYNEEGCLSVSGFEARIKRYENITVEYFNRLGKKIIQDYTGFLAVAWQHEIDHLQGSLFVEKLSILDRKKFKKYFKKS